MFNRITFKKLRKNRPPDNITLINFLNDKSKYLKDEIVIGHCKGHDCIFFFFLFLMVFMIFTRDCFLKKFLADK